MYAKTWTVSEMKTRAGARGVALRNGLCPVVGEPGLPVLVIGDIKHKAQNAEKQCYAAKQLKKP